MTDILFLDFDGVLHPVFPRNDRSHFENQHFSGVDQLADALDAVAPAIKIVVSSTWRFGRTMEELRSLLGPRLGPRVIGATPNFNLRAPGVREAEARAWIDSWMRNRPLSTVVRWCALDDMADLWYSAHKVMITDDGFRANENETFRCFLTELLNAKPEPEKMILEPAKTFELPYDDHDPADIADFGHD